MNTFPYTDCFYHLGLFYFHLNNMPLKKTYFLSCLFFCHQENFLFSYLFPYKSSHDYLLIVDVVGAVCNDMFMFYICGYWLFCKENIMHIDFQDFISSVLHYASISSCFMGGKPCPLRMIVYLEGASQKGNTGNILNPAYNRTIKTLLSVMKTIK